MNYIWSPVPQDMSSRGAVDSKTPKRHVQTGNTEDNGQVPTDR